MSKPQADPVLELVLDVLKHVIEVVADIVNHIELLVQAREGMPEWDSEICSVAILVRDNVSPVVFHYDSKGLCLPYA